MRILRNFLPTAAACGALLASCTPGTDDGQNNVALFETNAAVETPAAVAERPLNREQLLIASIRAASAVAAGRADPGQRALDGKRFRLALRFGCGAQQGQAPLGWTMDEEARTMRVSAAPTVDAADPLVAQLLKNDGFEAVEGFWVPRPWILTDACPAAAPATPVSEPLSDTPAKPASTPAAAQRIAIASLFAPTDARTGRQSGRGYAAVVHLEEGEGAPADGLNLILFGRLKALPDGRVIACVAGSAERPPDCLISVDIDQVRLERPGSGAALADWTR